MKFFRSTFLLVVCFAFGVQGFTAQIESRALLKADKLYIKKQYELAAPLYVEYLKTNEKDYYASRQAAICFDLINDHYSASDHWPAVVESSEVTELDYLGYARCLLANDRGPEAAKLLKFLSRSRNPWIAEWAATFQNPQQFYKDSADTHVRDLLSLNSGDSESCPYTHTGKFMYLGKRGRSLRAFQPSAEVSTQRITTFTLKDSLYFDATEIYRRIGQIPVSGQFCITPDGNFFYFCQPIISKGVSSRDNFVFAKYQLFILNLATLNDQQAQVKAFGFNSTAYNILHPALSADGSRLYFASDMKGSAGGYDIFACEWQNNDWLPPVRLGNEINTPGNELFPYLGDDGKLFFASDHRPGLGGLDMFVAEPAAESGFRKAKNLGAPYNSRFDDFGICFIKGFRKGYFTSNRKGNGDDDLYFFSQY